MKEEIIIMKKITKDSMYYVDLDLFIDDGCGKTRPVVVLQNSINGSDITIIPISTKKYGNKMSLPYIEIEQLKIIRPNSAVLLNYIKNINKKHLKGYIGNLCDEQILEIIDGLILHI